MEGGAVKLRFPDGRAGAGRRYQRRYWMRQAVNSQIEYYFRFYFATDYFS
jgi:hypothetical protein